MKPAARRSSGKFLLCIGMLLAWALVLTGCGGGSSNSTSNPPPGTPAPSASQPAPGSGSGGSNGGSGSTGGSGGSGGGTSSGGTTGGTSMTAALAYVSGSNNNFYGIRVDSASNISTVAGSPYSVPGIPNSFASTGSLLYVASVSADFTSGTITAFRADSNGALSQAGNTALKSEGATTITIDSSGKFLYASGNTAPNPAGSQNAVFGFSIDQNSGALTALSGSPWYLTGGMGPATGPKISPNGSWLCVDMELARTNEGAQCYARHSDGSIDGSNFVQPAVSDTSICGLTITADSSHMIYTGCGQSVFSTIIENAQNGTGTSSGGARAGAVDIDPTGHWLALTDAISRNLAIFSVGVDDSLKPAGTPSGTPSHTSQAAFSRSGTYVFVASGSGTVVFSFDPKTGALTALNASNPAPGTDGALATM